MSRERVGRNDPCPCGSGKKYKSCCEGAESSTERWSRLGIMGVAAVGTLAVAAAAWAMFTWEPNASGEGGPDRVWSEEHGHYHDR